MLLLAAVHCNPPDTCHPVHGPHNFKTLGTLHTSNNMAWLNTGQATVVSGRGMLLVRD